MRNVADFVISIGDFAAKVKWSDEDNLYVGHLILKNQRHTACFSSEDITGLEEAMKEAVECYLEALEEFGEERDILVIF